MFSAISRVITNNHDQITVCANSSVKLIQPTHHEATIARKQNNRPRWIPICGTNCLLHSLTNCCKIITHVKAVGVWDIHAAPNFGNVATSIGQHDPIFRKCFVQSIQSVFKVYITGSRFIRITFWIYRDIMSWQFFSKTRGSYFSFI
ncbi:Uncharacterised protein [marine metagenome]